MDEKEKEEKLRKAKIIIKEFDSFNIGLAGASVFWLGAWMTTWEDSVSKIFGWIIIGGIGIGVVYAILERTKNLGVVEALKQEELPTDGDE